MTSSCKLMVGRTRRRPLRTFGIFYFAQNGKLHDLYCMFGRVTLTPIIAVRQKKIGESNLALF